MANVPTQAAAHTNAYVETTPTCPDAMVYYDF